MPPRGISKDTRQLLKRAEALGCEVTISRAAHVKVRTPFGAVVHMSLTPSDVKAVHNQRRDLRHAGVAV